MPETFDSLEDGWPHEWRQENVKQPRMCQMAGRWVGISCIVFTISVEIHWMFFIYKCASTYTFISLCTHTEMWKRVWKEEGKERKGKVERVGATAKAE